MAGESRLPSASETERSPLEKTSAHWASLTVDVLLTQLGSSRDGLSPSDASRRLAAFGPNSFPRARRRPWYFELAANFLHFFALLLWSAAALAWLAGMPQLAYAILAVVLVNGLFSYWREFQAERAVEALEALLPRHATVRRQGQEMQIPMAEVVPGDLLILREGDSVPADARIVASERLRLDMSSLTGESRPTLRSAEPSKTSGRAAIMLPNLIFAGTTVVGGLGEAIAYAIGTHTEFGRIAELTQAQKQRPSPLEIELRQVTWVVTLLAVAMGVLFFFLGTRVGGLSAVPGFLFAVGIIVANVPEGMLPTLTLSLALGVRRMASRRALVKRLSAVETLGATTVILTDKTGTLTENEMTVREVWAEGITYLASGRGYEVDGKIEPVPDTEGDANLLLELLRTAALCCDARLLPPHGDRKKCTILGDPTEAALLVAAAKIGLLPEKMTLWPRLAELPFDSVRKRMTTIQQIDGALVACVKGAASEILPRCAAIRWGNESKPLDDRFRSTVQTEHDRLARKGLRVLAVATRRVPAELHGPSGWPAGEVERELTFLGLVAMEDPPRVEVPAAVAACREAGIRVVMVTGDSGLTAAAIGREIGLFEGEPNIVTGDQLDHLDEMSIAAVVERKDLLFARVTPEHKLRLVKIYQHRGEIVAVTGDGVNDAPALKRADIGVAMGETGTDVAREAADMVLSDDNFASIVAAVEEGRTVYDNVRKFVTYIFASNIAEAVPFIAFVLFRIPLPLTVMQVLAVDLGTDMVPALALGAERSEPGVMRRPPRSRRERLLSLPTLLRAYAWLGLIEAVLSLSGYFFVYWVSGWRPGMPLVASGKIYLQATTMSLAGIVFGQIGNVFACRSNRQSAFRPGWTSNRMLLAGIGVELLLLLSLMYVPPLRDIFGLHPLGPVHWLLLGTFGPLLLLMEELRKRVMYGPTERRKPQNGRA
jgi:Ca2+-transporting ATPase